ncbi:hypothetical protein CVT25_004240 [Psilocybe cyanescens]|uniref:MIT domain-containing protein n=1 Tax=Psilocybe cyanescens TaxID=93625 RepID=A0A409VS23_PSICY|nr:hypothetical protein CVT25_004240 [Psilocybe cyanescens]
MELEWETRPGQHGVDSRHWHEHNPPPPAFHSSPSLISQRRRSSAANTRPAGPPPNLPIPSLPPTNSHHTTDLSDTPRATRATSFARPSASPNLTAVAAFSQARHASSSQSNSSSMPSSIDDLSDPPPQSYLPPSSLRSSDRNHDAFPQPDRSLLVPPTEHPHRSEQRPSSRRALTRALELAREAVQLDSTNDNPEAAVAAYARSVALLSEVMERVRNGEDSTTDSHRRRRRRSVAAQEEEVRRLQNIHDTYADRMNILSIIYSIPAVPYPTTISYSTATISSDTPTSSSPTTSTSPSSDSSPQIPQQVYTPYNPDPIANVSSNPQYTDARDSIYRLDESVLTGYAISELPNTSHPYAVQYDISPQVQPTQPPSSRNSVISSRKSRSPYSLPPKPPPPSASLPPPPVPTDFSLDSPPQNTKRPESQARLTGGESTSHRRTPSASNLGALEEENEDIDRQILRPREDVLETQKSVADTVRPTKRESPPLPPLPSPPLVPETNGIPRSIPVSKPPPSPRLPDNATLRPRAMSQVPLRTEVSVPNINSTNQGTLYQRRKTSAPPSSRSSSPAESTASTGSVPQPRSSGMRSRSSSQPGRRPSIVGGRTSPDQRPPLPEITGNGAPRKKSGASKPQDSASFVYPVSTFANLPTTPTSPLPPAPPSDPLLKPYHMMNLLRNTMVTSTGGYVTRRLHVPHEVWSQGGAKLNNLDEKIRVVTILCSALEDLESNSAEHFGAGNVSSGMALGIGSIGRREADAWLSKLDEFSNVCDHVVANFGKKLGVGEGFVSRKPTWGGKLFSRLDKFTNNGKNLDSPAAYVQGLKRLFMLSQLLDEHTRAILSQPIAPAYGAFPLDLRGSAEQKLKRFSQFFASVVLTFVIQDLSLLLDKYVKKCEKWLAE